MMCFKTNKQCAICLQDTNISNKCSICSNTNICSGCMLSMVEHGQSHICPVCRQKDWNINIIPATKICPITIIKKDKRFDSIEIVSESLNDEDDNKGCCSNFDIDCNTIIQTYRKVTYLLGLALIIGLLGGLTFYIFNVPVIYIIEVSIFIYFVLCMLCGLIEISCCWCCCCPNENMCKIICFAN